MRNQLDRGALIEEAYRIMREIWPPVEIIPIDWTHWCGL